MPQDKPGWGGRRTGPDGKLLGGRPKKAKPITGEIVKAAPAAPPTPRVSDAMRIMNMLPEIVEASKLSRDQKTRERTAANNPFTLPWFPKIAIPKQKGLQLAMDSLPAFYDASNSWLAGGILNSVASEALIFPGYTYLSMLSQQPDFRNVSETIAEDATRQWIKFEVVGSDDPTEQKNEQEKRQAEDAADPAGATERNEKRLKESGKQDKVKALTAEFERLRMRDVFYALARDDGYFGRVHLYLNFGTALDGDENELKIPIGDGSDALSRGKITKGMILREIKIIEPVWCYPTTYNANNPLADNWYNPQVWYVMGKEIHASRLLRVIGRPVPDILKPAYAFGGMSLSQLVQPSVDIWLQTRNSVSSLLHSFSVMVLHTDLSTMLQPGSATSLLARAALFSTMRDNQGLMIVNKDTEDMKNVSAPIAGLSDLQAQAQEHVASTARIPLVKYTGLQPKGLNASAEGEIAVYDDTIMGYQNRTLRPHLMTIFNFVQLCLFGEIDPEITIEFETLRVMTEKEKGDKQKADAERDGMYLEQGAISPEEIRARIVNDPELPYTGLDADEMPEPPQEEGIGGEEDGGEGAIGGGREPPAAGGGEAKDERVLPFGGALDDWNEGDHPRGQPGNAGQFGSGGGGGSTPKKAPAVPRSTHWFDDPAWADDPTAKSAKQNIVAPQYGMPGGKFTASQYSSMFSKPPRRGNIGGEIDPSKMTKVGKQMGSNEGGVYEDENGDKFYVKKGKSKDHVRNEMIAAALYDLAGTPTLNYRTTPGGTHIATEIEKLDKDNAGKLNDKERAEAQKDFAVHAWLGNWDAVGLGGDNLGTVRGMPTALDLGGALEYRAQGAPKGKAFGDKVTELATLRDKSVNKDAHGIFGDMTPAAMRSSARYVMKIPDSSIRKAVEKLGGDAALADKLIERKKDIGAQARMFGDDGNPKGKNSTMVVPVGSDMPVKELNGVPFAAYRPPADWAGVEGQMDDLDEPAFDPGKKKPASGVFIREPDGRVWLVQPRGGYGGYEGTFPKGGAEEGLSLQANAIKEAWEESGLKVRITGFAGDHEGDMTHTRYYHAVREGGDPSRHEDETEGVMLAPVSKAEGFLNRSRDRKVLASDEFKESDHPRDDGGKFTEGSGGGGGSSSGAGGAEGKHGYETIKTPYIDYGATEQETFVKTVSKVLASKDAPAGSNYRRLLVKLIKDAGSKFGSIANEYNVKDLKAKLIASLGKSMANSLSAGKVGDAKKLAAKMKELGAPQDQIDEIALNTSKKTAAEVTAAAPAPTPKPAPAPVPKKIEPPPAPKAEPAPAPKFPAPTEAELAKAKKTVALQLQYVPGHPESGPAVAEANKLVAAFNEKYANKEMTSAPALIQKVNDFKMLAEAMKPLQSMAQKEQAALAEKQAAENAIAQKKAQAEAKEKAAAMAAKAAAEAKANAEKNKHVMAELGIDENQAEGFNALVGMLGDSQKDVVSSFQGYAKKASQYGYPITGFQAAIISNYSNGGYNAINSKLRSGAWTPAQHVYVKMANKALAAMPAHTGVVTRNTSLTNEQLNKYLQVGHVIQEDAFMSTSTSSVFSGNVQFKVTAIGKRGASIKKLSNHSSENEVLFQARTFFKVDKVDKGKGNVVIHMTEWED